jgi:DEAD/DEAH box helicase domain-containing protein
MLRCPEHREPDQRFLYLQVGYEPTLDTLAERDLEFDLNRRVYIRGPWRRASNNDMLVGVYCKHCLDENIVNKLTLDQRDIELEELDDPVLIFKQASEFRINDVWEGIQGRFSESIVAYRDFEAQPPVYGELDQSIQLDPDLGRVLFGQVLPPDGQLYRHQVEGINTIYAGNNVTIVTTTASGKTLVYAVPVLDSILKDPEATTLYLAPLNALVEDQLEAFTAFDESGKDWEREARQTPLYKYVRKLDIGDRSVRIARYDGNVPDGSRRDIRDVRPNIVITNPEMLHWGILSWASSEKHWRYLFENLRFVVVDEMHTYKGIFGSNFANLMRRLRRLCHYLGSNPQFICASATIKNPGPLAQALTGQDHIVIGQDRDGAPRCQRRFVLWDATRTEEAINTDASNLMETLVGDRRVKTITFARSIPSVDAIYRYVSGRLRDTFGKDAKLVSSFKRALTPDMKRQITRDLREGRLHGVVTTTALKLGIDIGDLSAALVVKYPGSIADVWQQAGRAGRKGEGLIVLLADQDPLNQYFVNNPDDFFAMEPEEVYVDPDSKYIVLDQLWCATNDWEIDLETDRQFFGDSLPEYLDMLDKEEKIQRESARDVWILRDHSGYPAAEVPIRAVGFSFDVIDDNGNIVAREDASRATRYLHKYARYSVQDEIYEVTEFDLDRRRKKGSARVRKLPRPVDYLTSSVSRSESSVIKSRLKRNVFGTQLCFGDIEFRSQVWAYYKIPLGGKKGHQAKTQFQPLGPAAPPERVFETTSIWIPLEPRFAKQYDEAVFQAALRSMGRAMAMAITIQEFCDPADVGNVEVVDQPDTGQPTIFLHDTVPGGIGIAEQTYYDFENVFRRAYRILKECPNAATDPDHLGCPLCVTEGWGDETVVNRPVAIEIMETMLGDDPVVERKSTEEINSILISRGFRDLEYVKAGGMGRIYRGKLEGKDLAIKVINPVTLGLSSEAQERMAREASIWKKLVHPNIVRLHEVNQPEGLFHLTMDWMPRGSLRDRLPVDGMELEESKRIALGISRALAYLAGDGYVHRDVNPNNILFDSSDQPRLADFGIAKSVSDDLGVQTKAGIMMGTFGYQPPEQLSDAASCDDRADVFALGIVLFEMLTGKLPGRDTIGAVTDEALAAVQDTPFAGLLRQMLAAKPADRPSAEQVTQALEKD